MRKSKRPARSGARAALLASSLLAFIVVLCAPLVAWAQSAGGDAAPVDGSLARLSNDVMAVLVPVFVSAVGLVATWALHKLRQKLHLQVSDQTLDAWAALAQKAALRGAEWARNEAKDRTEGKNIPGPEILQVATNWALEMAEAMKLPELARKKVEGFIEAELHSIRLATSPPPTPVVG